MATAEMLNAANGKSRLGCTVAAKFSRQFSDEVWDRLLLMWDSRQFDEDGGYDTSFGKITQFNEDWPDYHSLYRVVNEFNDIEEGTM